MDGRVQEDSVRGGPVPQPRVLGKERVPRLAPCTVRGGCRRRDNASVEKTSFAAATHAFFFFCMIFLVKQKKGPWRASTPTRCTGTVLRRIRVMVPFQSYRIDGVYGHDEANDGGYWHAHVRVLSRTETRWSLQVDLFRKAHQKEEGAEGLLLPTEQADSVGGQKRVGNRCTPSDPAPLETPANGAVQTHPVRSQEQRGRRLPAGTHTHTHSWTRLMPSDWKGVACGNLRRRPPPPPHVRNALRVCSVRLLLLRFASLSHAPPSPHRNVRGALLPRPASRGVQQRGWACVAWREWCTTVEYDPDQGTFDL